MRHLLVFLLVCSSNTVFAQTPEDLTRRLADPDSSVRRTAAEKLGKQKVEAAIPALRDLLKDKDAAVRQSAASALIRFGPKGATALVEATAFPDEASRLAALRGLIELGADTKEAIAAFQIALKDKNVDCRIHAATGLGELGKEAIGALPALFDAAKDTGNLGQVRRPRMSSSVCESAVWAALEIDPNCRERLAKAVLTDLTAALQDKDPAVVEAALFALNPLGKYAAPALEALREAQKKVKGFGEGQLNGLIARITRKSDAEPSAEFIAKLRNPKSSDDERVEALSSLRFILNLSHPQPEKLLPFIREALKDASPKVRAEAVQGVAEVSKVGTELIPILIDLLDDEKMERANQSHSRYGLVPEALACFGKRAVPALIEVIGDRKAKPKRRWESLKAISCIGRSAKEALPVLEKAAEEAIPLIAIDAACAYIFAGGDIEKVLPVLRGGLKNEQAFVAYRAARAVESIGGSARKAVPELLKLLDHSDPEMRIAAAHALAKMGADAEPAIPRMVELIKEKDGRQRYQITEALSELGPHAVSALPALIDRLSEEENTSPHAVLSAMSKMGPAAKPAVPALIVILKKPKGRGFDFKGEAAKTLGSIGPAAKDAVPALIVCMKDENSFTRRDIARGLGGIGPMAKAAVPELEKALEDEKIDVRVWAAYALARMESGASKRVEFMMDLWQEKKTKTGPGGDDANYAIAESLAHLGKEARPARDMLLKGLKSQSDMKGVQDQIVDALAHLTDDSEVIVPKLLEMLEIKDGDRPSRYKHEHIIVGLGHFGPKASAAIPKLRKMLEEAPPDLAEQIEAALEKIGKQ